MSHKKKYVYFSSFKPTENGGFVEQIQKVDMTIPTMTKKQIKERELFKCVRKKLVSCFSNIKRRCNNTKSKEYRWYGGRGIKCLIKFGELWDLWERDNAWKLKKASIDRIDNDGNYTKENCRFIELSENLARNRIK